MPGTGEEREAGAMKLAQNNRAWLPLGAGADLWGSGCRGVFALPGPAERRKVAAGAESRALGSPQIPEEQSQEGPSGPILLPTAGQMGKLWPRRASLLAQE